MTNLNLSQSDKLFSLIDKKKMWKHKKKKKKKIL